MTVIHTIGLLERDLRDASEGFPKRVTDLVYSTARDGQKFARRFATKSARRHGIHYPNSIQLTPRGDFAAEYGPDPSRPQGGMSFEYGKTGIVGEIPDQVRCTSGRRHPPV
jgi:hypothetical protein